MRGTGFSLTVGSLQVPEWPGNRGREHPSRGVVELARVAGAREGGLVEQLALVSEKRVRVDISRFNCT